MQSRAGRIGLIAAALAVAVVAFLVLRPSDDDPEQTETAQQTETAPGDNETGGSEGAQGSRRGGGEGSSGRQAEPEVPTIEFRNGEPVGGVEEIEAESGGTLEFVVESDTPDEIHVHGFDITKQVAPDQPARFSFPADLEGVFEVEMHDAGHVLIAELRVTP